MSHSFRSTKQDDDNIAKIQLDRGGISVSEAFRVALHECASRKPRLAIVPSMAPPKHFAAFKKIVQALSEDLMYVAETGLPHATSETAPADRQAIEQARVKFQSVYMRVEKVALTVELLGREVAALQSLDVPKLQTALLLQRLQHEAQGLRAVDDKLPAAERKAAENWVQNSSGPILELLRVAGLRPPASG